MTVATFDTLKYANTLKAAGVPEKQAEAQADVLAGALMVNLGDLVTKSDLASLKNDMGHMEERIRAEFALLRAEFTLVKWIGGAAVTLLLGVLVRLLFVRIP